MQQHPQIDGSDDTTQNSQHNKFCNCRTVQSSSPCQMYFTGSELPQLCSLIHEGNNTEELNLNACCKRNPFRLMVHDCTCYKHNDHHSPSVVKGATVNFVDSKLFTYDNVVITYLCPHSLHLVLESWCNTLSKYCVRVQALSFQYAAVLCPLFFKQIWVKINK